MAAQVWTRITVLVLVSNLGAFTRTSASYCVLLVVITCAAIWWHLTPRVPLRNARHHMSSAHAVLIFIYCWIGFFEIQLFSIFRHSHGPQVMDLCLCFSSSDIYFDVAKWLWCAHTLVLGGGNGEIKRAKRTAIHKWIMHIPCSVSHGVESARWPLYSIQIEVIYCKRCYWHRNQTIAC